MLECKRWRAWRGLGDSWSWIRGGVVASMRDGNRTGMAAAAVLAVPILLAPHPFCRSLCLVQNACQCLLALTS
eukprot:6189100-Pleurochrysis_carterae.AAC.1